MKKKLLWLGSMAVLATPIVGVISCAKTPQGIIDLADKDIVFISDGHSLSDGEFTQSVYEGVKAATNDRVTALAPITTSRTMDSFYDKQIKDNKKLLVLSGFEHSKTLSAYASTHKETKFVLVDAEATGSNIASVKFSMKEIATIAGFRMAHYVSTQNIKNSTNKQIGIYGGMDIGPVQDYILGVKKGIEYYNIFGKNKAKPVVIDDKGFAGSFSEKDTVSIAYAKDLVITSSLILSVGGPQYKHVLRAIGDKTDVKLVGVDMDVKKVVSKADSSKVWGSILKNLTTVTTKIINDMKEDYREHVGSTYLGDIYNGGTGLVINGNVLDKNNKFGVDKNMFSDKNIDLAKQLEKLMGFANVKQTLNKHQT